MNPEHQSPELVSARVVQCDRGVVTIWIDVGVDLRATSATKATNVVAGDRVLVDPSSLRIAEVLPRTSVFVRRAAKGARRAQASAANIDVAMLCHGLDRPFNVRRLERELVLAYQSGATPVVVLTKSDVDPDAVKRWRQQAALAAPGLDVIVCSITSETGLDELRAAVPPGATVVLLGSSGVGKSSLVNALRGDHSQSVGEVRSGDNKGRHTTTASRLIELGDGRFVVDTPGVRALALWDAPEGLAAAFPEITELTGQCRFSDCAHRNEPGCAVTAAVESGTIDRDRFEHWCRLGDELSELERPY